MSQQAKKIAAEHALSWIEEDAVVGVGTGSTVAFLIDALASIRHRLQGAIASSEHTAALLKSRGIPVLPLSSVTQLPLYIDGADAIDASGVCLKGGGAALTREKILADAADVFVCIVDESKVYEFLPDTVPLTLEVIEMARSYIARKVVALGGQPVYREGCLTDQGHQILDVYGLEMRGLQALDQTINQWPGVVAHGLFYQQRAHHRVVGHLDGQVVVHAF